MSSLGFEVALMQPFEKALARTRDALKAEGFGVLTEVDLKAAFKEKIGKDFRQYVMLGACNPPLAFKAINAVSEIGLLLPCNVTVEAAGDEASIVRLIDPEVMLGVGPLAGVPELKEVATDARARLVRVADSLRR